MKRKLFLAAALPALLLDACSKVSSKPAVNDTRDLSGYRVGVNLAWEGDYIMTERYLAGEKTDIYRFDETAGLLLALQTGKIDCFVLDETEIAVVKSQVAGIKVLSPPVAEVGYIAFFNRSKQGLLEDFNAFVAEWRESEEYKDYIRRIKSFDGSNYSEPELPSLKDGLPVTVGYCELSFPRSFPDAENGEAKGFDMEPLKRWAFARGYSLKMTGTSYEDMEQGTRIGNYDIGVGYIGDCYAEESRKAGVLTSSSFSESSLQVCVKSRDGIAVTGDIDKL